MFSSIQYRGKVATVNADLDWGADLPATLELVGRYFADFNDNGFYAHPDEEALRQELRDVATLHRLHRELGALKANGIALAGLGLKGLPEPQRNAALYALTLTLGYPTSTDQRTGRVAWDVKARPESGAGGRFSTFSERVGSADMHTDSSFYPMPEEQFILYVVRAARCNGGHSLLIDGEDIYQTLQQTAAGRSAYEVLRSTPLPFRVPSIYAAGDDQVEYYLATVFGDPVRDGDRFTLRWRHDAIVKGLAARPDMNSAEVVEAVALMHDVAERLAPRFKEQLPDDTLMLTDNHRMLHGRTTYEDEQRHLIRIRISDIPNAQRIGPSGVVRD